MIIDTNLKPIKFNNQIYMLDFDDFMYLSNFWAEWFNEVCEYGYGCINGRKYANCDEIVAQSLEKNRIDRKDIITE